ncbi:thermonuclease family protein [Candidatus Pelagibacter sp.]|uniref:thermonuclease family protein n=1 Tax=Candidatus Pelagibacter sp. TaxID=2024849 RepID=UPI003F84BB77|tara:strand:- start:157 stop:684 length:528 start_codon:yes stop_codon:yes gene_type:complete
MFYTKKKLIILIIISSIFFILTYNDVRSENINKISGFAKVVDGDTIKINSKKIRLYGIDAPEKKQKCKKTYLTISFMSFTKDYMCGEVSTQKLIKKINKQKLNCNILDVDRYKRLIGECFKRNINLNSWMVSNGYAVAYRKYSKKYVSDEINAKNNKLGIWQGKFEMPWDYRRKD